SISDPEEKFDGTVTIAPKTNKKPAIDSIGTNLPNLGKTPKNSSKAIKVIIKTPENTGLGALPVAEIIDSKGAPPNKLVIKSATELTTVNTSTSTGFVSEPVMLPVIIPKEIFEPIFKHASAKAPRRIFQLSPSGLTKFNLFSATSPTKSNVCFL